jgi:hypothetical protein
VPGSNFGPFWSYNRKVALLVCPFCRELFQSSERDTCAECGVRLCSPEDLPRAAWEPQETETDPWLTPLAWHSLAAGRGAVLATTGTLLGLFFLPWLVVRVPASYTFSGFELATTRGFWFSGGAIACLVQVALVFSRRTRLDLRRVRIMASLLGSVSAWQTVLVLGLAGVSRGGQVSHSFTSAFYLTGLVSVLAAFAASRLGGNPKLPGPTEDATEAKPDSRSEQPPPTLH